jgi:hypothetical protein
MKRLSRVPFIGAAVGSVTSVCIVTLSSAGYIEVGASPTATNSTSRYLPANVPTIIPITAGHKIAAIQDASGGNLHVCEVVSI